MNSTSDKPVGFVDQGPIIADEHKRMISGGRALELIGFHRGSPAGSQLVAHRDVFQIKPVRSTADLEAAVQLFNAYASSIGVDLGYQDFATELATLPGKYATPAGELLLARDSHGKPLGCVGLRPIKPDGCCEMKRLYVSPKARGLGLGKALIDAVIDEAVRIGYSEMRLDSLPTMAEAISLYKQAGFVPIEPPYETPIAGTLFFARPLAT